jgi:hypothetical protein
MSLLLRMHWTRDVELPFCVKKKEKKINQAKYL